MRKDIVVIGTSAGGIDALKIIVSGLPEDFGGAIFIVLHTSPESPNVLAGILTRAGRLPAHYAVDGERVRPGTIYVAPADHHLVLEPGKMRVTRGPKENRFRPAVDPLFRSAAQVYGPRAVGVILTGRLDDGTSGLWIVKQLGGTAIVQEPDEAFAPSMPLNALQHVRVDHRLPLAAIAPQLVRLAATAAEETKGAEAVPEKLTTEVTIAKDTRTADRGVLKLGDPSLYACPECHGVLLNINEAGRSRFRCHTGHAYTLPALLAEIDEKIEESLWSTIRALEERLLLVQHAATHLREADAAADAAALQATAAETLRRAELVRQAAMRDRQETP